MIVLGIDIGGTRIKAGCVDESGRIVTSAAVATPSNRDAFRSAIISLAFDVLKATPEPTAAGIGCKGIIDPETARIRVLPGTLNFMEGENLRDLLAPALPPGTPVAADNDAKVAMAGEMSWGAARGRSNALMLTLGTGVGGGVVVDGKLLRGVSGVGGHIGHLTVDPDGSECMCGNHGCLETIFSARAIESEARAAAHRGCASLLLQMVRDGCELSCEQVFDAAQNGDETARYIVARATRALAAAIAGLVHVFDPEVVILGGQISEAGDSLFREVEREVWWRTKGLLRRKVPIIPPQVADPSGVIGAAALGLALSSEARFGRHDTTRAG
jgi:glucokinase